MYQAIKVNNHVCVFYGYRFCLFLRFLDWNLERCGIYVLGFFLLCMFFSLLFRFFLFSNNILVYIYYLCQLGITTAVQTEKQKNVLNLEPLNVVL